MSVFFVLSNEVNAIHPEFAKRLGFAIRFTNVGVQKIDNPIFETYKIIVIVFLIIG